MRTRAPVADTCTEPGEERHTRANGRETVARRQGIRRSVGVYNMRPRIYKGAFRVFNLRLSRAHARAPDGRYTPRQQDGRTIEP